MYVYTQYVDRPKFELRKLEHSYIITYAHIFKQPDVISYYTDLMCVYVYVCMYVCVCVFFIQKHTHTQIQ